MLPCRSRCLRILLTAILGTSVACPSTHTALALSRQSVRAQHASRTREEARTAQHKIDPPHRRALVRFGPADLVSRHRRAMHSGVNSLINATWDDPYVSPEVIKAIQSAALTSAIDPHLLSALAWRESRLRPQPGTNVPLRLAYCSSPREHGSRLSETLGRRLVSRITRLLFTGTERARSSSANHEYRVAILKLRSDPVLSAQLAAESMRRQRKVMEDRLGRVLNPVDLYLLHVLGPTGAFRFLNALVQHPSRSSVEVASAKVIRNAGLMASDGRPMTIAGTYAAAEAMLTQQRSHSELLLTRVAADPAMQP